MTSLSDILLPDVDSRKEDADAGERQAKRRKLTPPHVAFTSAPPAPDYSTSALKDQRKAKWLAGLSHEELLGIAQGATWQVGGLHSKNCFTCKRPGTVLECYNCPRSYHRRCLDPPIHGNFKLDGPWFCPNCALLMSRDDNGDSVAGTMISHQKKKSEEMGMKIEVDVDNVTPLHREKEISLEPKRSESPTRLVSRHPLPKDVVAAEQHGKYHKKSRYSTLSSDIDEALGLLNRELEQARQRTMIINEMTAKIKAVEQEREMWKGRAELLAIDRNAVLELGLAAEVKRLRADNGVLKKATETLINESKRKEQEWEGWRRDMQTLINEK